jgi:hypothetical protein
VIQVFFNVTLRVVFNCEEQILGVSYLLGEDVNRYFFLKRRTEEFQELLLLQLFVMSALSGHEIATDVFLRSMVKLNIGHSGVGNVDLLLEFSGFGGAHGHQDTHFAENNSQVYDQEDQNEPYGNDLGVASRSNFITTQRTDHLEEALNVGVQNALLMFIKKTVYPCRAYKVKVSRVDEFSLILDHLEPNTSEQVNEKE